MAISNRILIKIASIGGVITCSLGMLLQWKVKDRIRQTDYYQDALKTVRSHPGAISLMGQPIKEGDFNMSEDNYCDKEKAHFQVNLRGPKQNGVLYLWATKLQSDSDKLSITRIELGLEKESDRRLLIKNINH